MASDRHAVSHKACRTLDKERFRGHGVEDDGSRPGPLRPEASRIRHPRHAASDGPQRHRIGRDSAAVTPARGGYQVGASHLRQRGSHPSLNRMIRLDVAARVLAEMDRSAEKACVLARAVVVQRRGCHPLPDQGRGGGTAERRVRPTFQSVGVKPGSS